MQVRLQLRLLKYLLSCIKLLKLLVSYKNFKLELKHKNRHQNTIFHPRKTKTFSLVRSKNFYDFNHNGLNGMTFILEISTTTRWSLV